MAATAGDIITTVARTLHDTGHVRWPLEEKLRFLNLAQLQVVMVQPQATAKYKNITLTAGARQSLTAPDMFLLTITRNMGVTGLTPGRYVAVTDRATMDASLASWTAAQAVVEIESYVVDGRVDGAFFVYPPPTSSELRVECVVSERPADCVNSSSSISLADRYVSPIMHWMYYLCLSYQLDSPASSQQALSHYQLFFNELGLDLKASDLVSPNYREQYLLAQSG